MVQPFAQVSIAGRTLGLAVVQTSVVVGLQPCAIRVEVGCTRGPAFFQMVGLPEASVREARVRVASALATLGILLDEYALTVNLAPADLRKSGAALDLAIAVGVLVAIGDIPGTAVEKVAVFGELSLDGRVQPIRGALPQLHGARERGISSALVPVDNAREAGLVTGLELFAVCDLEQAREHLTGRTRLPRLTATTFAPSASEAVHDLASIRGQATARRALEVATAGGHNLLMVGPPGCGKTMLARSLPGLLPELSFDEAIECTAIHSVAGLLRPERGMVETRPFRAPHHSVSEAGLVGGGELPRPGEVSLAHNGVLFLDEFAEFRRSTLESLRQPLEDGSVCIARARARAWFPAKPMVVAAMNPCACGYLGHPQRSCRCSRRQLRAYRSRVSGPLLDRLDVHVALTPVAVSELTRSHSGESSAQVRARVARARAVQRKRFELGVTQARLNAQLPSQDFPKIIQLDKSAKQLLKRATTGLGLSARAFAKVLRVARSIADLEMCDVVSDTHIAEAVAARLLEENT